MAFCISQQTLNQYSGKSTSKVLYLKRNDIEFCAKNYESYIIEDQHLVDIRDWPTMEFISIRFKILGKLINFQQYKLANAFASIFLKTYLIKKGGRFLCRYNKIYTTRLHVAILAILLNKPFVFFDNSYGKNRFFYETWLKDLDNIYFID